MKRKRSLSPKKLEINDEAPNKKNKSAESNKKLIIQNVGKVRNFFAQIDKNIQNNISYNSDKLVGNDLNMEFRRKEAISIISSISHSHNQRQYLEAIEKSLSYDNTNQIILYKVLEYYHIKADEEQYIKLMNNSKYCLTKKIKIKINDEKELPANLDDFYPIKIPIYDFI